MSEKMAITIQYNFTSSNFSETFNLELDTKTLEIIGGNPKFYPSWAKLDFCQCSNCPLAVKTHPYCPLTVNIVNIVRRFEPMISYNEIHLEVITKERVISQDTTAQRGISSLMGVVIATCGCPRTEFFKPMARFHLPLATEEETIYRTTSMYLLAQYFLNKNGKKVDFDLNNLITAYKNMHIVNTSISKRLRTASKTDSTVNAIVLLDMFAQTLPMAIEESLEEIQYLFEPFLKA